MILLKDTCRNLGSGQILTTTDARTCQSLQRSIGEKSARRLLLALSSYLQSGDRSVYLFTSLRVLKINGS